MLEALFIGYVRYTNPPQKSEASETMCVGASCPFFLICPLLFASGEDPLACRIAAGLPRSLTQDEVLPVHDLRRVLLDDVRALSWDISRQPEPCRRANRLMHARNLSWKPACLRRVGALEDLCRNTETEMDETLLCRWGIVYLAQCNPLINPILGASRRMSPD